MTVEQMRLLLIIILILPSFCFAKESMESLLYALEVAAYWDKKMNEQFPVTYNHLLSTGYFTTPSARMTPVGNFGVGIAYVPPYLNLNARVQPFKSLELSTNYRIFRGCQDQNLSKHGFGDYADRGANFKMAVFRPEDSYYMYPGIAFGIEDFMGSKKFTNYFVVATQVFPDYGFEGSLGWGAGRYSHGPTRGFFGGFNWFPFYRTENKWIEGICVSAEYDPIDYKNPHREPHPKGRKSNTPINFGVKYHFKDLLELSLSSLRGRELAATASFHCNLATPYGFIPKVNDPPPYCTPKDTEPLGVFRPQSVMIQQINYALLDQGFQLTGSWLQEGPNGCGCDESWLILRLINCRYRQEACVRMRLQYLLASLIPSNVDYVKVIIESYGVECQQYVYSRALLLRYSTHCISPFEFDILTPREDVTPPNPWPLRMLFKRPYKLWRTRLSPRVENFFGSASGKYKYDVGVKADIEGFLPKLLYYEMQFSYTLFANIHDIGDFDLFSPSQLPNVATDFIRYRQENAFSVDRLYLQKSCNWNAGFYTRAALGYFQVNYGGIAGEMLWYPAWSCVAIGLEGALVKKRNYSGLGFQSKLRQLKGFTPTFHSYTALNQYFLSLYWDLPCFSLFTKLMAGQFLARDKGVRLEATRYFENGIRLTGWITYTNAKDKMHGKNYFDRGIALEVPFDLFFRCSSRRVWNYGLAAWLRDAGYMTTTGKPLFEIINKERRF